MKPKLLLGIALLGVLLGGAIGLALKAKPSVQNPPAAQAVPSKGQLDKVPEFSYPDLEGKQRQSKEWANDILVLNFWASWCPPCREETPLFVELQEQYQHQKVRFVGIAIDDPEPVQDFADTYAVNYPILLGDIRASKLSRQLGNRFEGLPFTLVAEPGGRIILRHAGGISREQLEPVLQQAIKSS